MIKITTNNSTAATFQPPPPASSGSAVEVSENHDLLTEILLYLPIKSLIKFKSVSKQWLYLISNHQFSLRRSASPASPATGLFIDASQFKGFGYAYANVPQFDFIDLNNPSPQHSTPPFQSLTFSRIVQSCNGLLLCSNAQNATDGARQTLYVHNPTTKQYTTLPPLPPHTAASLESPGVALAFDPSKSPHYKVICVTEANVQRPHDYPTSDPYEYLIDIYSSSDEVGGWRSSALGPFKSHCDGLFYSCVVFWNGAVHWLSCSGPSMSFDVEEELMRDMPMPPLPDALEGIDRIYSYFGESGGHMHFVDHILEPGESRLNVYEMERDYSGWFVKYSVDLSKLGAMFPEMVSRSDPDAEYAFSVFCVVRGEVEEGSYLVINIPGKILRYNFASMACCKLCDVPMVVEVPSAYQYIESLACV